MKGNDGMTNDLRVPLPEELEPFRADLEYFFSTMVRKLHVNRHKGTSKELHIGALVQAIRAETDELDKAIKNEGQFDAPLEACDVANFAFLTSMTIWHMTRAEFEKMRNAGKWEGDVAFTHKNGGQGSMTATIGAAKWE